jgi:regulator of protease activity HflC (stomatin/prohibitin superfamily)
MTSDVLLPIAIPILIVLVWLFNCLNILREYERAVVFRLGRVLKKEKGPGLVLIVWPIDKIVKVSLRVVTWDVPPQDVITRDNVSLKVNAVVYYRVISATKAIIEVENFRYAVEQAAQTGLRSVLGEVELDDLLAQRDGHRLAVEHGCRFSQLGRGLELAFGRDDLRSSLAFRLGLGRNRPLHLLWQVDLLDLDLGDFDAPTLRLLVENRLEPHVQLLPLRQEIVQLDFAEHRTQAGLGRLLHGVPNILDLDDGLGGANHSEVDDGIDLQ